MLNIGTIKSTAPAEYTTALQKQVYEALNKLDIPFKRVDTSEAITMEDCVSIERKLSIKMVKTLFLCNRQQTEFYLFITTADKPFKSKDLSAKLNISRLSFAPPDIMKKMLDTKVGAATIFGLLLDLNNEIKVVIDEDVLQEEYYGCSDGTTTCYMKINISHVVTNFLNHVGHKPQIINL